MANPFPLAWGRDGEPLEVPKHAVGWRVRRLASTARGGALEVVTDDEGQPLICALETPAAQLYELAGLIPGRYRLDAVDESGRSIGIDPAYTTLKGGGSEPSTEGDPRFEYASFSRSLDAVERLARTNAEAMRTMAEQVTLMIKATAQLVEAADSAGVTRRQAETTALVVQKQREPDDDEATQATPQPSPWVPILTPVVEQLAPQIPALIQGVMGLISANRALAQAKQSGANK